MTAAYPLHWPDGWPRTSPAARKDSKTSFRTHRSGAGSGFWTFDAARSALAEELERLNARNIVLSTNYELRLDGQPRASAPVPNDTGVAVYFSLKSRPMVMACDMHLRAEENMRSITLAIEAMRQLARHGGGVMMEKAFTGFLALSSGPHWSSVLGVKPGATRDEIAEAYRARARAAHPDVPGGSAAAMAALNGARDAALREAAS